MIKIIILTIECKLPFTYLTSTLCWRKNKQKSGHISGRLSEHFGFKLVLMTLFQIQKTFAVYIANFLPAGVAS